LLDDRAFSRFRLDPVCVEGFGEAAPEILVRVSVGLEDILEAYRIWSAWGTQEITRLPLVCEDGELDAVSGAEFNILFDLYGV
jgi:hypothetical protein